MNWNNTKPVLWCIVLILFQGINLQAQDERLITANKLVKDFDHLIEVIDAHPDPYTHISEEDFNIQVERVRSTIDHPLSDLDFFKKVAPLVALIKDGHSSVRLPKLWLQKQRRERGAFPYEVHLTNEDELYVIKGFEEPSIPNAAKIISINGISTDSFLRQIDPFVSYEMKNFRNTIIDQNFEEYLYLAFGFTNTTSVEYIAVDTVFAEISNMPYKEWRALQKDDREERDLKIARGKPYDYQKVTEGVGLISIYSFSVSDIEAYNLFLLKTFETIEQDSIHSLVIDIRGNFGGWPKVSSQLFHYISDIYFKTMARSSTKISAAYRNNVFERIPALKRDPRSVYSSGRRHFIDMRAVINDPIDSYVDEDAFFNEEPITKEYEFDGSTYLLMNRDSYSAASSFAATFQCYQMGIIIGEETGGTKIFRANALYETLGRSGLRVKMSTTKLFTTCYDEEFQGVEPHVEYIPSIFEIISDLDTQLLYTLRVIGKVQQQKTLETED